MCINRLPGRLRISRHDALRGKARPPAARVLPSYRAPFFDLLASACDGGMSLFTGLPRPVEGIATTDKLNVANYRLGKNIHLCRGRLYLCYQSGLIEWLRDWKPDALIVEANPRYLATPAAVRWMHARGKPVIGWGLGAPARGQGGGKKMWSAFVKQFDALVAYSQRGADEYAALGFPREMISVAHNSVSPAPTSAPDDRPRTIDHCTILFVGRLQARKRIDHLLKACGQLEPKPRLVIVGDGPERESLQRVRASIPKQNLSELNMGRN